MYWPHQKAINCMLFIISIICLLFSEASIYKHSLTSWLMWTKVIYYNPKVTLPREVFYIYFVHNLKLLTPVSVYLLFSLLNFFLVKQYHTKRRWTEAIDPFIIMQFLFKQLLGQKMSISEILTNCINNCCAA